MHFLAPAGGAGSSRAAAVALPLAALTVAIVLALATPAQARRPRHEPYGAKAWGSNKFGQLGDGTSAGPEECGIEKTSCSTTPGAVHELSEVTAVAGGHDHSLAL